MRSVISSRTAAVTEAIVVALGYTIAKSKTKTAEIQFLAKGCTELLPPGVLKINEESSHE